MINIPEDVQKYLVKGEIVNKQFTLEGCNVFTSTDRMFIKKGNAVKDISYNQISSIESQVRRKWLIVIIGILLIVYNYLYAYPAFFEFAVIFPYGPQQRLIDSGATWIPLHFLGIIGFSLLIFGYFRKTQRIYFSILGISRRQKLSGDKDTLDALFRLVNERRLNLSNIDSDTKSN